jgi:predicted SprT family Zn-dependent metalloprotease
MSKWNVRDVQVIIKEIEERTGESLGLDVKVNGRLKRAIARCFTKVVRGKHIPTKLEFGKAILEVDDYEIFRQVTLHEIAHAIANKRYQDNCKHDNRFIKVCHEIGCTNTGAYCSKEYSIALQLAFDKINGAKKQTTKVAKPQQEVTKYSVICEKCGHTYHKSRACDVTKNPSNYRCGCGGNVKVQQNW